MSEPKGLLKRNFRLFLLVAVVAAVVYLIARNLGAFGNVLLVVIGFGLMVLVHELGHFVVAKLLDIKVTAFSIGFPPTLTGIQRTEKGYRIRILPGFFRTDHKDESDGSLLTFTIGKKGRPGETEYRIGLVPFGGYNKILGQEDTKAVEAGNDPRSFANKPVGVRMAVIAAGVFFNAVSAILIFMIVFLIGIKLTPPVVGGVVPDKPAARAGLRPGDEIIEIAGRDGNLDFRNIVLAALLSGRDEKVRLKVKRGTDVLDFALAARRMWTPRGQMRAFGIDMPMSLTVADVSDPCALCAKTGLKPGDRIKSVNGRDVKAYWDMMEVVRNAVTPSVCVLAERTDTLSGKVGTVESQIRLKFYAAKAQVDSEADLCHIYSMVPRLRVTAVRPRPGRDTRTSLPRMIRKKLLSLFGKAGSAQQKAGTDDGLRKGDVILAIGDIENPTYKEMRDVTKEYEGKELPIKVLRRNEKGDQETIAVTVVPERPKGADEAVIGIGVALDMEHPVVAKTIDAEAGPAKLEIPRGASITAVDNVPVPNFYELIRQFRRCDGQRISIDWRIDEKVAGSAALSVDNSKSFIRLESEFAEFIPFNPLERLYKASGPLDAIAIGCRKTFIIVTQTYLSVRRLFEGLVSRKELSGPVGIVAISYQIAAKRPLIELLHFLGLISILLAIFNLCIPVPPVDGGWLVLLLVEKVKGSALSERAQEAVAYVGLTCILALLVYLTYNDILNFFFR